ncbi:unnamed protein product [Pocillopora meandrina]|uniref:Uncharacterized protein n=1 Tax=Pocillopora meandrina TaxID=46732 RepID=A0AAU9W4R2_9CNID|nr:unnamed protein product [Pocillopora meandrina]
MERSKMTPVHNKLVFSSLFLFVICFAGLIHVEIELYAHRQMLQGLSQLKEEKVELKNTANDKKTNEMIRLFPYSHKGGRYLKPLRDKRKKSQVLQPINRIIAIIALISGFGLLSRHAVCNVHCLKSIRGRRGGPGQRGFPGKHGPPEPLGVKGPKRNQGPQGIQGPPGAMALLGLRASLVYQSQLPLL